MLGMPGHSYREPLPPLAPQEEELRERLALHVRHLAGEIGERNVWRPAALAAAAGYLEARLAECGYEVGSQAFDARGETVRNLEAELPGGDEIVVVGGHYDSVFGCPGANDNATGAAAVVELARLLAGRELRRTVRFVAFVNEEPPFFQTADMGSLRYARRAARRGERIAAMLALETIGYYSREPGSQRYPFPFGLLYPRTGDFIGFVGNLASAALVRRAVGSFRRHARFPSEGVFAPDWVMGIGWSDHWSFWRHGYPALMVTDTAPFRYAHYHTAADTPDQVDYASTARVVAGLARVVADLAGLRPAANRGILGSTPG